ncbi:MAG: hypothetical protein WB780_00905 [Candidatus Acidiferrales bacterium]
MKTLALIAAASVAAIACASCGGSSSSQPAKAEAAAPSPAAPKIPPEIQAAAEASLGSDTDVLAFGDLAKNGHRQLLAVNRVKGNQQTAAAGTLVSRVAVVENDGGAWKELFRCDEHLKNTEGFLGGIPLAPVNGWRLQYEQDAQKGLQMYFTPIAKPAGGYIQTIGVRWNPQVKRYQSLDRTYEQFLGEVPSLEIPQSELH